MDVMDTIKSQIEQNPVILYMKGSPDAPQCGFSMKASIPARLDCSMASDLSYAETINILGGLILLRNFI